MQSKDIAMSPLSELVWSPDEGLSIKIAASNLSTRKASFRWNAETLNIVISSPQQSAGGRSADNIEASTRDVEKMPSRPHSCSDSSIRLAMGSPNRGRNPVAQTANSIRSQEEDSKCCGEINLLNEVEDVFDNDDAEKMEAGGVEIGNQSIRCCKHDSHDNFSHAGPAFGKEFMSSIAEKELHCATSVHDESCCAKNVWRTRLVEAVNLKRSILLNNAVNTQPPASSENLGDARNIAGKSASFVSEEQSKCSDNDSKEITATAVSQFHHKLDDQIMKENPKEASSGIKPLNLEKGKEKVVYNDNNSVSNTRESDDGNESIESCPSTAKITKRKHVQYSMSKTPFGNKRHRREDNGSSCSGLMLRTGSSFFKWMSTLTNGPIKFDESNAAAPSDRKFLASGREDIISHPVLHQNKNTAPLQSVGFNSLFQSLYCHNVMITSRNSHYQTETNHTEHVPNGPPLAEPICMGTETFCMATETLAANNLQMVCCGDTGNSKNQTGVLAVGVQGNLNLSSSSNKSCSRPRERKWNEVYDCSSNVANENGGGFAESNWVTRLLPKTSRNLTDATPFSAKSDSCYVNPEGLADKVCSPLQQNFNTEKECHNVEYLNVKGSNEKTMPSKFKQSGAMASIFSERLDALNHAKTSAVRLAITCDHEISKGGARRTNSLVVSYSSHDGLEPECKNCISPSKDGRIVLWVGGKCKEQQHSGSNEELRGKFISKNELECYGTTTTGKAVTTQPDGSEANPFFGGREVKCKEEASNSMENLPNNKQIVPYGITTNDICAEQSVVFGALQRIRLSRSHIMRWLRSPIMHTTLDGFFLRLRFGRWEEALGGTGYHVARINGVVGGNRLSVSIRNSTCQVDARFVSNHDFDEAELKAWWSAAMKGDYKLPSKEELDRKLRQREFIRF